MASDSTNRGKTLVDICYLDDDECSSRVWRKMYTIGPVCLGLRCREPSHCFKNGGELLIPKQKK